MLTAQSFDQEKLELLSALASANDRILALYDLSHIHARSLDSKQAVQEILQQSLSLTNCESAAVLDGNSIQGFAGVIDRSQEIDLINKQVKQKTKTWEHEGTFIHSLPLPITPAPDKSAPDKLMNLVFWRSSGVPFDTADSKLIEAIGSIIKSAIELSELHHCLMETAVIQKEHNIASTLAQAVLRTQMPTLEDAELFAHSKPAQTAGGDFYTSLVANDTLYFAVGDVAGKGLPAALVMTRIISASTTAFIKSTEANGSAEWTLQLINEEMYDFLSDIGLFATILIGAYNMKNSTAQLCNAGHSPVLIQQNGEMSYFPASSPPLGVMADITATSESFKLHHNDLIVVGSDGLAEQENDDGIMFGYDRLKDLINSMSEMRAKDLAEEVFRAVTSYAQHQTAGDDQTLFVLRVYGSPDD